MNNHHQLVDGRRTIDSPSFFRTVSFLRVTANPRSCDNTMRAIISELCGVTFIKTRPSFLRNPATNRCLELDAYNSDLQLACEYNGLQHAVYPNQCHRTESEFLLQQHRDKIKAEMCKSQGVRLIIIHHTVDRDSIEDFLRYQLFPSISLPPLCSTYTSDWKSVIVQNNIDTHVCDERDLNNNIELLHSKTIKKCQLLNIQDDDSKRTIDLPTCQNNR